MSFTKLLSKNIMKHAKSHGGEVGSGAGISGLLRNTHAMRTKHVPLNHIQYG